MIHLTLRRKGKEIFYWKGKGEVDFLIRKGTRIAKQFKTIGLLYLEKKKVKEAVKPFKAAIAYQLQLKEEIDKIFFGKVESIIKGKSDSEVKANPNKQI